MSAAPAFDRNAQRRRGMLAKVHLARKELGLDEDTYRAILRRLTGHESAGSCNEAQLGAVLDEFKVKGWKPTVAGKTPAGTGMAPILRAADHAAARKARAMWISLHQLAVVRDASEAALEAFGRRQLGVEKIQWTDQARMYRLIEALKAMAEREGWSQDLAGVPAEAQILVLKQRLLAAIEKKAGRVAPPERVRYFGHRTETLIDAQIAAAAEALAEQGLA